MEAAAYLIEVKRVEHLPVAVDRQLLILRVRRGGCDAKVAEDRAERGSVLLDIGQTLEREGSFVGPCDRVVIGVAEEEPAKLVHEPVPELRLGEAARRGARSRRRGRRRIRRERSGNDRPGDRRCRDGSGGGDRRGAGGRAWVRRRKRRGATARACRDGKQKRTNAH